MNNNTIIFSVYPEFTELCRDICSDKKINIPIFETIMLDALKTLDQFIIDNSKPPAIIITRGATADLIQQKHKEIIVLRAEPDGLDILASYFKANAVGKEAAFLIYAEEDVKSEIEIIMQLRGLKKVNIYTFVSQKDIEKQVFKAKQEGVEVLIGGGLYGTKIADQYSLPVIFIKSRKKTIAKTINRAIKIIEASNNRQIENERFRSLISSINDGIISVDKENKIIVFNHSAEKMFDKKKYEVIGKALSKFNPVLDKLLRKGDIAHEILPFNGKKFITNSININENQENPETILIIQDIIKINLLEKNIRQKLKTNKMEAKYHFENIITDSSSITDIIKIAKKFSTTDESILITGETGTGKELFAHSIHNYSNRKKEPFVIVNCSAIPNNLLESELFGYEEGAFTGAKKGGKLGLFELSHCGTIFLDEINSLALDLQAKILRIVQDKNVFRLGSDKLIPIDVRILAATNKNLKKEIEKKLFREDLYYRLSTLYLNIPPLRDREYDIILLANYFINLYSDMYNKKINSLNYKKIEILTSYKWYGNVRELENIIKRYVILFDNNSNEELLLTCLNMREKNTREIFNGIPENSININKGTLVSMEKEIMHNLLIQYNWQKNIVADLLGISRTTLWRKLKE